MLKAAAPAAGSVGAAVEQLDSGELVSISGDDPFPMQSVFKLPLAMAVLIAVDQNKLHLEQIVHVSPEDYVSKKQHSPLRDHYPNGIRLPLSEILRAAASESDGSAADILLKLVGGPKAVTAYLRSLNIRDVEIAVGEKDMGQDPQAQYKNWATPLGAISLLRSLHEERGLSRESRLHLLKLLTETPTGHKRIKGRLPEGTTVAHKTGSSRTVDGITSATNDIGIVTLPDGKQIAVAIFVSQSPADIATRERVIADISRAAYDFWSR